MGSLTLSLRIRRSQVRVLPSAPIKVLHLQHKHKRGTFFIRSSPAPYHNGYHNRNQEGFANIFPNAPERGELQLLRRPDPVELFVRPERRVHGLTMTLIDSRSSIAL